MTNIVYTQNMQDMFPTYNRDHPMLDMIKESLIGARYYDVKKNSDLLPKDVLDRVIYGKNTQNAYVAVYYLEPHLSTLVTLYNVVDSRVNDLTHSLTYQGQWFEHITIQNIPGEPQFTRGAPLLLPPDLSIYPFNISKKIDNENYREYQNNNLIIRVRGSRVSKLPDICDAWDLITKSSVVMISLM